MRMDMKKRDKQKKFENILDFRRFKKVIGRCRNGTNGKSNE